MSRNYPNNLIDKKIGKAQKRSRENILRRNPKKKADNKVRLIFTHNAANPPINKWIRESQKVLLINDEARELSWNIKVVQTTKKPKEHSLWVERGCT